MYQRQSYDRPEWRYVPVRRGEPGSRTGVHDVRRALHAALGGDRRERRVVSVLFADLVGFTSRSELLDVEDVEGFLARYHGVLRRALERCGGTVEKFIGDAVMALFGAPVAHEDDAERAVRAALAIQDAMAELRDHDGVDLHVRVGVTTGEALVALRREPAVGRGPWRPGTFVNTAARSRWRPHLSRAERTAGWRRTRSGRAAAIVLAQGDLAVAQIQTPG